MRVVGWQAAQVAMGEYGSGFSRVMGVPFSARMLIRWTKRERPSVCRFSSVRLAGWARRIAGTRKVIEITRRAAGSRLIPTRVPPPLVGIQILGFVTRGKERDDSKESLRPIPKGLRLTPNDSKRRRRISAVALQSLFGQ